MGYQVIVLEGPDGAGKTQLAQRLSEDLGLPLAQKFVKSDGEGSGTNDLFGEAYRDVVTMMDKPPMIYDRHPLISEYVYGPIVRGILPPDFVMPQAHATLRLLAEQVHVIWCLPALQRVADNVADTETNQQMSGVWRNIEAIYSMYHTMRIWWIGHSTVYDYTVTDQANKYSYESTLVQARLHVARHIQEINR